MSVVASTSPSAARLGAAWLACCIIWGTTWVVIRVGLSELPPFLAAGIRFLLAAAILFFINLVRRRKGKLASETKGGQALFALFGVAWLGTPYACVYWAEQYISSGLAAVLFATLPIFVALSSHWLLEAERLTVRRLGGMIVGFGGVVVLFSDQLLLGHRLALAGVFVILGSAMLAGLFNVIVKRWATRYDPLVVTSNAMGYAAVFLLICSAVADDWSTIHFGAKAIGSLLYLSILGSAAVFWLYTWLLWNMSVNRVSLISYFVPIIGVAFGAAVFGEPLTWRLLAGAACVLAGTALATRKQPVRPRDPAAQ